METGTAYTSPAARHRKARVTVTAGGRSISKVVPAPRRERIDSRPPSFCTRVRTTSMPTPRPEMSVVRTAVERPGMVISINASSSLRRSAASRVMKRFSSATRRSACGSIPRPSSEARRQTRSSRRDSSISMRPAAGLPAARRVAASSMPWSMLLRRMCSRGSIISSRTERSSATSVPRTSSSTSLPSLRAKSRTVRCRRGTSEAKGMRRIAMTVSRSRSIVRSRASRNP